MNKIVRRSQKQQAEEAELGLIIDEFGKAMREANRNWIAKPASCGHDVAPRFTLAMDFAWGKYVGFCQRYPSNG